MSILRSMNVILVCIPFFFLLLLLLCHIFYYKEENFLIFFMALSHLSSISTIHTPLYFVSLFPLHHPFIPFLQASPSRPIPLQNQEAKTRNKTNQNSPSSRFNRLPMYITIRNVLFYIPRKQAFSPFSIDDSLHPFILVLLHQINLPQHKQTLLNHPNHHPTPWSMVDCSNQLPRPENEKQNKRLPQFFICCLF